MQGARSVVGACVGAFFGLSAQPATAQGHVQFASADELSQLSIEQLANVEIMSVSRRMEPVRAAPAAIYVITADDIRRVGARSVPDALRLAPNLQVARINSANYAISARGFNHSTGTANKLLVLIDGRTVYTPLYSGVFWDTQNVMLDDIDRIEVVSGPGGTLWGANAVNGVINIITRDAHETEGTLISGAHGDYNSMLSVRHGGDLGADGAYRVYAMGMRAGPSEAAGGGDALDEFTNYQAGFRTDWGRGDDTLTLQGDIYSGAGEDVPFQVQDTTVSGGNVLGRWSHRFTDASTFSAQLYYDNAERRLSSGIIAIVDTVSADLQYDFTLGDDHHVVLGGGGRVNRDTFTPGPGTVFLDPDERTLSLAQVFVQDTYALRDDVDLIVGLKLENNSYTGLEYMPNARLAWQASPQALVWASVSRAARTPSRLDSDLINPGLFAGGPNFASEYVTAYELGLRAQPIDRANLSISFYLNDYDDLRTIEATTALVYPLVVANGMEGQTYGVEAWGDLALTDWWRLSGGVNLMRKELEIKPGSADVFGVQYAGNDPDYQWTLHSLINLNDRTEFDLSARGVGELPSPVIPAYVSVDARLSWRLNARADIALAAYDLFDDSHAEFSGPGPQPTSIPRSVLLSTRWRF